MNMTIAIESEVFRVHNIVQSLPARIVADCKDTTFRPSA